MKPVSSRKTMLRPCLRAFFYMGPTLRAPAFDLLFVALAGPPLGLLATPTDLLQEPPDMARVIRHAEFPLDHLRHALQRPQFALVSGGLWTALQQLHQVLALDFREFRPGPPRPARPQPPGAPPPLPPPPS